MKQPDNNQIDDEIAQIVLTISRTRYADFGTTLPCEKLRELHGVDLSKQTICKLTSDVGLWVPRSQRPARIQRPRNRRQCLGELSPIDSSDHRWFKDWAPAGMRLVSSDVATRRLMQVHSTYPQSAFSQCEGADLGFSACVGVVWQYQMAQGHI